MGDQISKMPEMFSAWCRGANIGEDSEKLEQYWLGASGVIEKATPAHVELLLHLVFGRSSADKTRLDEIRKCFKDANKNFSISGNDNELLVLSGATLASLVGVDSDIGAFAAMAITTASIRSCRNHKLDFDLLGMAEEAIRNLSISSRKRPSFGNLEPMTDLKKAFDKASKEIQDQPYPAGPISAVNTIGKVFQNAFTNLADEIRVQLAAYATISSVQDEELQMLWWLINGWSEDLDQPMGRVAELSRPLVMAKELSELTESAPGPKSIESLFARAGLTHDRECTIVSAVNAAPVTWLQTIMSNTPVSLLLTPIQFAISRKLETGDDSSWVPGWAAAADIPKDCKLPIISLATLFYRERLVQRSLGR